MFRFHFNWRFSYSVTESILLWLNSILYVQFNETFVLLKLYTDIIFIHSFILKYYNLFINTFCFKSLHSSTWHVVYAGIKEIMEFIHFSYRMHVKNIIIINKYIFIFNGIIFIIYLYISQTKLYFIRINLHLLLWYLVYMGIKIIMIKQIFIHIFLLNSWKIFLQLYICIFNILCFKFIFF